MKLNNLRDEKIPMTLGELKASIDVLEEVATGEYSVGENFFTRLFYKGWANFIGTQWDKKIKDANIDDEVTSVEVTIKSSPGGRYMLPKVLDKAIEYHASETSAESSLVPEQELEKINVLRGLSATLHQAQ